MTNQKSILWNGLSFSLLFFLILYISSCNKAHYKHDSSNRDKVDSLIALAEDSISDISYSRDKVVLALKYVKDTLQFHKLINLRAYLLLMTDSIDTAKVILDKVIEDVENRYPVKQQKKILSTTYNVLGIYYTQVGNYDSALISFQRAYNSVGHDSKITNIEDICINIADTYFKKGNYSNAALYFRKALLYSDSVNSTQKYGFPVYFGLGQVYLNLRDYELSDHYFSLAEKKLNNRSLSEKYVFCNNRGTFYYYKEEYPEALKWFKKARDLVVSGNYEFYINLCELNMSDVYLHMNQLDSSQYYSDRSSAFFSLIKHPSALFYISTIKAGIALKQNNLALAYYFLENSNDTVGVEINMISVRNKCLQDYYEHVGDFKQAYEYLQKNYQIENNLQSERVKGRVTEIDLRYKQDTTLLRRDFMIKNQKENLENLQLSRYLLLLIIIIILVVALFTYLYMRKQHDLLRMKHIDQIAKLRIQNIRNRISPHFIFNVLNREINDEKNKEEKTQLTETAKLLRRSLEISENLSVTLTQELDFVHTYINLEQKSLGDNFFLFWEIDNISDYNAFYIPAMIVQIPVENAIKHALRGKEGDKVLKIKVIRKNNGVFIIVEDNGPGYHPGLSSKAGTGTGLKVIYQTINLLNTKNSEQISFIISDIKSKDTTGTKVEIFIPDNYSYKL